MRIFGAAAIPNHPAMINYSDRPTKFKAKLPWKLLLLPRTMHCCLHFGRVQYFNRRKTKRKFTLLKTIIPANAFPLCLRGKGGVNFRPLPADLQTVPVTSVGSTTVVTCCRPKKPVVMETVPQQGAILAPEGGSQRARHKFISASSGGSKEIITKAFYSIADRGGFDLFVDALYLAQPYYFISFLYCLPVFPLQNRLCRISLSVCSYLGLNLHITC